MASEEVATSSKRILAPSSQPMSTGDGASAKSVSLTSLPPAGSTTSELPSLVEEAVLARTDEERQVAYNELRDHMAKVPPSEDASMVDTLRQHRERIVDSCIEALSTSGSEATISVIGVLGHLMHSRLLTPDFVTDGERTGRVFNAVTRVLETTDEKNRAIICMWLLAEQNVTTAAVAANQGFNVIGFSLERVLGSMVSARQRFAPDSTALVVNGSVRTELLTAIRKLGQKHPPEMREEASLWAPLVGDMLAPLRARGSSVVKAEIKAAQSVAKQALVTADSLWSILLGSPRPSNARAIGRATVDFLQLKGADALLAFVEDGGDKATAMRCWGRLVSLAGPRLLKAKVVNRMLNLPALCFAPSQLPQVRAATFEAWSALIDVCREADHAALQPPHGKYFTLCAKPILHMAEHGAATAAMTMSLQPQMAAAATEALVDRACRDSWLQLLRAVGSRGVLLNYNTAVGAPLRRFLEIGDSTAVTETLQGLADAIAVADTTYYSSDDVSRSHSAGDGSGLSASAATAVAEDIVEQLFPLLDGGRANGTLKINSSTGISDAESSHSALGTAAAAVGTALLVAASGLESTTGMPSAPQTAAGAALATVVVSAFERLEPVPQGQVWPQKSGTDGDRKFVDSGAWLALATSLCSPRPFSSSASEVVRKSADAPLVITAASTGDDAAKLAARVFCAIVRGASKACFPSTKTEDLGHATTQQSGTSNSDNGGIDNVAALQEALKRLVESALRRPTIAGLTAARDCFRALRKSTSMDAPWALQAWLDAVGAVVATCKGDSSSAIQLCDEAEQMLAAALLAPLGMRAATGGVCAGEGKRMEKTFSLEQGGIFSADNSAAANPTLLTEKAVVQAWQRLWADGTRSRLVADLSRFASNLLAKAAELSKTGGVIRQRVGLLRIALPAIWGALERSGAAPGVSGVRPPAVAGSVAAGAIGEVPFLQTSMMSKSRLHDALACLDGALRAHANPVDVTDRELVLACAGLIEDTARVLCDTDEAEDLMRTTGESVGRFVRGAVVDGKVVAKPIEATVGALFSGLKKHIRTWDTDALELLTQLLCGALDTTRLRNKAIEFWNDTFGRATVLKYPKAVAERMERLHTTTTAVLRLPCWTGTAPAEGARGLEGDGDGEGGGGDEVEAVHAASSSSPAPVWASPTFAASPSASASQGHTCASQELSQQPIAPVARRGTFLSFSAGKGDADDGAPEGCLHLNAAASLPVNKNSASKDKNPSSAPSHVVPATAASTASSDAKAKVSSAVSPGRKKKSRKSSGSGKKRSGRTAHAIGLFQDDEDSIDFVTISAPSTKKQKSHLTEHQREVRRAQRSAASGIIMYNTLDQGGSQSQSQLSQGDDNTMDLSLSTPPAVAPAGTGGATFSKLVLNRSTETADGTAASASRTLDELTNNLLRGDVGAGRGGSADLADLQAKVSKLSKAIDEAIKK